jgi:hypothetical protein
MRKDAARDAERCGKMRKDAARDAERCVKMPLDAENVRKCPEEMRKDA